MTKKLIPRSPLPNEVSAKLPRCSAITKTGKQCRNAIVGRGALERMGQLEHPQAGELCAFHLIGARALSDKGHAALRQARKLAAETAAAKDVEPDEQNPNTPGDVIAELDADRDYAPESEAPLRLPKSIYTISLGDIGMLTPEQRRTLLRARLRES